VTVAGRAGIAPDAAAAVLTITALGPAATGAITVWPARASRPEAPAIRFVRGETSTTTVHVRLGTSGAVSINVAGACVRLLVDATGSFAAGTLAGPGGFTSVPRTRVFDSRRPGSRPCVSTTRRVRVAGLAGVPATAAAVALDVTTISPRSAGGLSVLPTGATSTATVVNFTGGDMRTASLVVRLGTGGTVSLRSTGGCPDVVLFVAGWYRPGPNVPGGGFVPLTPTRLLNTRATGQGPCVSGSRALRVAGVGGVPANAAAVMLNLTAVGPRSGGNLTVYPSTAPRPTTAAVSYSPARPATNSYVVPLGTAGRLNLFASVGCPHVVGEVAGYVTPPAAPPPTTTSAPVPTTATPASGPTVESFSASSSTVTAPGLVALTWAVSDPNGDPLTCTLDLNGDGTDDLTVAGCEQGGSRLAPFATAGTFTPRLRVTDGTSTPATSTASVAVTAGTTEPFDITMRNLSPLSPTVQAAFDSAAARWSGAIARGIPSQSITIPAGGCDLATEPGITGTIDDLVIDIEVHPIDGPGLTLASAGPCSPVYSDGLPRFGVMEFDSADIDALVSSGTLTAVVTHEMAHVLGLGTWWNVGRTLRAGTGTASSRFTGPLAKAAWSTLGRSGDVPLETAFGAGTNDSHWVEAVFDNELMTGIIDGVRPGNPLSELSIASLADMGYRVDLSAADAYALPGAAVRAAARSAATAAAAEPFDQARARRP
jgi:hypothetical protein